MANTFSSGSSLTPIPDLPGSSPIVFLQARNDKSLQRSLANLRSSVLHETLITPESQYQEQQLLEQNQDGWMVSHSGDLKYMINCPADDEDTVMGDEPITPQQQPSRAEISAERYQRILLKRQEAEERETRKRKRSESPTPEVRQSMNVVVATAVSATTTDLTMGDDGYPVRRGQQEQEQLGQQAQGQAQPAHEPEPSPSVPSSSSLEMRANKKFRVGTWLESVGSPGAVTGALENQVVNNQVILNQVLENQAMVNQPIATQTMMNQTTENQTMQNQVVETEMVQHQILENRDAHSESVIATRVIHPLPLRRSERRAGRNTT